MNRQVGAASIDYAPAETRTGARPQPVRAEWDAFEVLEALGGGDAALWVWEPGADRLRVAGATRSLGLAPLGGAASTAFWCDPVEDITAIFMTQLEPSSAYPIRAELRTLVNQAIID